MQKAAMPKPVVAPQDLAPRKMALNRRARKREERNRGFHALHALHERFDAAACLADHFTQENERQERAQTEESRLRAEWERCMATQRQREAVENEWELVPRRDDEWEVVVATGEGGETVTSAEC